MLDRLNLNLHFSKPPESFVHPSQKTTVLPVNIFSHLDNFLKFCFIKNHKN